uniref:Uncharacterized protein n=1 Tax=Arundo donax TaxID=35708 RepID=A0A0A9D8I3_ARUDO
MTNFIFGQPNFYTLSSVRANSTAFLAILQLSSFTRASQSSKASSFIASNANSLLSEQIQLRTNRACSIARALPLLATPESTETMPGILHSSWRPSRHLARRPSTSTARAEPSAAKSASAGPAPVRTARRRFSGSLQSS